MQHQLNSNNAPLSSHDAAWELMLWPPTLRWERVMGGHPRRRAMHSPWLWPAKMAMPLSWE